MAVRGGSGRALFVHWNHWNIRLVGANEKIRPVQARSGERAELPCALGSAQTCCVASTRSPLLPVRFLLLRMEARGRELHPWGAVATLSNSARCFVAGSLLVQNR